MPNLKTFPVSGTTATISGNIVKGAGDPQFRFSTSPVDPGNPSATLVLTGAAVSNQEAIFTRGNIVYAGSGSFTDTSASLLAIGRSSATANLNLTVMNNATISNTGTGGISVDGLAGTSDDENTTVTIENNGSISAGAGPFNLNDSANANSNNEDQVTITMSNNANITAGSFAMLATGKTATQFTINGGTLTAGASSASWFPALFNTNSNLSVSLNGPVTINNAGFGIAIAQPFSDGGGYINYTGTGTTTLNVSQNFSNSNQLSAGTLLIGTGAIGMGGLTTTAASALGFNLGTGAGPIISNGSILTLGSNSATIAPGTLLSFDGTPVIGDSYQLIGGNLAGITNLTNFTLPQALSGESFSLGVSGGFIDLTVAAGPTHVSNITWNDLSGGNSWDTATTVNWNTGGLNTVFNAQDNVTFNDNNGSATGRYAVTLSTTVSPGSVTFNNSTSSYTVSGIGSIGGTGSLTKLGTNTVTLSTSNTYSGGTSINAGVLNVGSSGALGTTGTVSFGGGTLQYSSSNTVDYSSRFSTAASQAYNVDTNGVNVAWASALTSSGGSLTKAGAGTLTLSGPNSYTGGTTVSAGKLLIGQAGTNAVFTGPTLSTANTLTALPTGALSISGSGVVQLADGVTNQTFVTPPSPSAQVSSNINLTSLSLTGTGTLDIGNNRIIIDYSSPATDPIASIEQWIANGFTDGETVGANPAIISSDIATDDSLSGFSYGIGYADGADGIIAGLPSGEIEIMYTLVADANLDGTVNTEDFTPFSNNLNDSGRSWDQGDFNYDGTVNSEDFTPFSHDLNESAGLAASETGPLASSLVLSSGLSLTNVPEPASMGLLVAAGLGMLSRRRRSRPN